jgi:uncharacterized RDD family membrane protein YckC
MVQYGTSEEKRKRTTEGGVRVGFGRRLGAYLIDYTLLSMVGFSIGLVISFAAGIALALTNPTVTAAEIEAVGLQVQCASIAVAVAVQVFYYVWLPPRWHGKTVGKNALKIRVVRTDGGNLTSGSMFLRHVVGYFVSGLLLGIGFLWVLWDPDKEALHDKLSRTAVIFED